MVKTKQTEVVESIVEAENTPTIVVEEQKEDSPAKLAFLDIMLAYKKKNPIKFAQKEQELLKKLSQL